MKLVIEMDEATGQVHVNGPLANKMVCYGMLKMAEDAIREYAKQSESRIVPATVVPMIRPNGNG